MINQRDIEEKDFSISMDGLIVKLGALQSAFIQAEGQGCFYGEKDLVGFGLIVRDIHDDLSKIYEVLYGDG